MEELVSVIIPTYNRENLILRSVNSVLNQSYKNLEVLVIDDCSSDNTKEVVAKIKDERLRYVKLNKNSGACVARNRGIQESKGAIIAFQDSDDVWHKDKLKIQIDIMIRNNADVSFCNLNKYIDLNKKPIIIPKKCPDGFLGYDNLIQESVVSTQCIVARKKCFKDIKFDTNLPRLQDWDVALELSKKFYLFHINIPLVDMYVQSDSISSHPEKGIQAIKILWEKHNEYLNNNANVRQKWFEYLGNYKLALGVDPSYEYACILKISIKKKIIIKYIMAKLGILLPIYKKRNI